ncbi:MAG: DNA phosphorothioation-dependent restriction protein DptF [Lachnospiraceae bacterium]
MENCKLVDELNRLRKSSRDSIDGIGDFGDFKKYMHILRNVEEELIEILHKIEVSGRKSLVLLCGSAGDGKSHLLSYLKNDLKLLDNYVVYNDATESSAPSKTAIETLSEALQGFSDKNLDQPGKNFILAINLGVLSNFVESTYGEAFKQLREYVINSNILTNQLDEKGYEKNSAFQHVSFSDYHMYNLTMHGINPEYVERILEKIFHMGLENPFYDAYNKCKECPLSKKCPVKHNYEFFTNEKNRKYVANTLVEVIIKDKEILTTREILNYIYDIVVAQNFNHKKIAQSLTNEVSFLKEYISDITPSLMYEYTDKSVLLNQLQKYDPLLVRSEQADEDAISYYVSSDVSEEVISAIGKETYSKVLCQASAIEKINSDKVLKAQLFNILERLKKIKCDIIQDKAYMSFLNALYYFNTGTTKKYGEIYEVVEDAIIQWCGNEEQDNICFDDSHEGIALYEHIEFEPYLDISGNVKKNDELQRFVTFITVKYENKKTGEIISLDIDYSLYELIYKLAAGYIQTAEDRNNHADFISFIQKMLRTGSADKEIFLVTDDNRKAIIEKTKFGVYKFKVVR